MDASVMSEPTASSRDDADLKKRDQVHQPRPARRRHPRRLHLGVLDRLIEDDRIGFDGISASAGAMSATSFASRNGRRPSTGLPGTRSPKLTDS